LKYAQTNILVTSQEIPRISDFGLSEVVEEISNDSDAVSVSATTSSGTTPGSIRWLAPELLLDSSMLSPTLACDTWSFGMSMLECYTMRPPWSDVRRDAYIISILEQQSRCPMRPQDASAPSDAVWDTMVACWHWSPAGRPPMNEVASRLEICVHGSPARASEGGVSSFENDRPVVQKA